MDESDHLTLVNAGDEEEVSQEEGGRTWVSEKKVNIQSNLIVNLLRTTFPRATHPYLSKLLHSYLVR